MHLPYFPRRAMRVQDTRFCGGLFRMAARYPASTQVVVTIPVACIRRRRSWADEANPRRFSHCHRGRFRGGGGHIGQRCGRGRGAGRTTTATPRGRPQFGRGPGVGDGRLDLGAVAQIPRRPSAGPCRRREGELDLEPGEGVRKYSRLRRIVSQDSPHWKASRVSRSNSEPGIAAADPIPCRDGRGRARTAGSVGSRRPSDSGPARPRAR